MTQFVMESTSATSRHAAAEVLQQFLAFRLAQELFAVEILRVQEIRGLTPITPIPNAPEYIRGVMNLRGTIVPVFDLRTRFQLGEPSYDRFTVIIVVMIGTRIVGLVVDAVSDVLDVSPENIVPPPEMGNRIDTSFLTGMIMKGDDIVLLLNLELLLGSDSHLDPLTEDLCPA
jgi:purine-binding chemotaxis protein CheW